MTIQTASAILQRLGPCRIAIDSAAEPVLAAELALMGCALAEPGSPAPAPHGTNAGFLNWTAPGAGPAFETALKPFSGLDALVLQSSGRPRLDLEQALFAAGWQRHPGGMTSADYGRWSAHALPPLSFWRRATATAGEALCTGGLEADARIARYAMAADHVRPGDHVLIDGEGAAEGMEILAALSRAGSIAQAGAGSVPDHQADIVIAFEPADNGDWAARLADHARMLRFDGRLVVGWRHTPGDNRRPADWEALLDAASAFLLPEKRWVQRPLGRDASGPQGLYPVPLDDHSGSQWLILVACANPLAGEGQTEGFTHPAYPATGAPLPVLVDFGAAYDNPWLYRAMVQMGERLGDDVKLARLAECVIEDSRADSADRGAALSVLGYRILELRLPDLARTLLPLIADFADQPARADTPPHVQRWRISLAFLAARLNELTGDRAAARDWYRKAALAPWSGFSPLLATKAIAAAFFEARLWLADGETAQAHACFRQGLDTALAAAACPHREQIGPADRPLSFYMQELAEVIDMGSQCANALAHFHLWERDPGLFWRQVDVRRFGLASWARDLERENQRLRGG